MAVEETIGTSVPFNMYSQIGQDDFVVETLKGKRKGRWLDIGAGWPEKINNTYLLEKEYDWLGISIEKDPAFVELWRQSGRFFQGLIPEDATILNYEFLLHGIKRIDYLSMDLEPPALTLQVLKMLPMDSTRFSVITYEHDLYRGNQHLMDESRAIFEKHGYKLVKSDTQEDWWIDPTCKI